MEISETKCAVEIEYDGGGRKWFVILKTDLDAFIHFMTDGGWASLSDVDATFEYLPLDWRAATCFE